MQNNNDDYEFHPRGIIKWHAFAALLSGDEQKEAATTIEELDIELLEDSLQDLDTTLLYVLENNSLVGIKYLEDNKIEYIESNIAKVGNLEKIIYTQDKIIRLSDIIDIIILD